MITEGRWLISRNKTHREWVGDVLNSDAQNIAHLEVTDDKQSIEAHLRGSEGSPAATSSSSGW